MSIAATDWVTNLKGLTLTEKGACYTFGCEYNPKWPLGYIRYDRLQEIWGYSDIRCVYRMIDRLCTLGILEARRSRTREGVLEFRLRMPKDRVSPLQKSLFPGSQDQQDDIRGMEPVTLATEWSDDERVPHTGRDNIVPASMTISSQNSGLPGQYCPGKMTILSSAHAQNERANPVLNRVGGEVPKKNLAQGKKYGAGRKLLTRPTQAEKNDDDNDPSISLDPIFQLYQQNIEREIGPILRANIEAAVDRYSAAWVAEAIEIAVNKGPSGRNWGYVQGVLRKWASEGKEQPQRTTGNKYEDDYASRFGGQEQADPGPDPAEADPAVQQLWGQVLADLQERLPRPAYDTYIKGVRALRTDQRSMTLEVPNRVIFAHLERSYYGTIQQSIKRVSGDDLDICFRLGSPAQVT